LAYLKLTHYSESANDSTKALEYEKSFKAFLRRSSAYFHLGKYQDAVQDVDLALEIQNNSKEALDLRAKILGKWKDVDGSGFHNITTKGNLKIVEVNGDEHSERDGPIISEIVEQKNMVFEDVEDDSSSDDD
jgi:tetratricopeptide (TPR) repeat protein